MNESKEKLAEYAHEAWAGWMEYLFSKGTFNDDGTWTMPQWAVERWQRQAVTKYEDLPESERDSDRAEADKMLKIVSDGLAYKYQDLIIMAENSKNVLINSDELLGMFTFPQPPEPTHE